MKDRAKMGLPQIGKIARGGAAGETLRNTPNHLRPKKEKVPEQGDTMSDLKKYAT